MQSVRKLIVRICLIIVHFKLRPVLYIPVIYYIEVILKQVYGQLIPNTPK